MSTAESLFASADDLATGRVVLLSETEVGAWACFEDDGKLIDPHAQPIPKDKRGVVHPGNCPGLMACTKQHEDVHESDFGSCCDRAQKAYEAAKANGNGSGIKMIWRAWYSRRAARSECKAFGVSVDCYAGYYKKYGCEDCYKDGADPKGEQNWRGCCDQSVARMWDAESYRKNKCNVADILDQKQFKPKPCPF